MTRWWQLDGAALGTEVASIAKALREESYQRRFRALDGLQRYEGRRVPGLYAGAYDARDAEALGLVLPMTRALTDTILSDIVGRQRPKPQFLTSGADWQTRRRARKLDRFVEAVLHQPQGQYPDAWELVADSMADAVIGGFGAVKVVADPDEDRICIERIHPWDIEVDSEEARNGAPRTLIQRQFVDRDVAIAMFGAGRPGLRKQIEAEPAASDADEWIHLRASTKARATDSVLIWEAWHLPYGGKGGRHCYVLGSGVLLWDEAWDRASFPFVFLRWTRERVGFWASGIVDEMRSLEDELNDAARRLQERVNLCSGKRTYYDPATVAEEHLQANDGEVLIPVSGMSAGASPPVETAVPPFTSAEFEWLGWVKSQCFEMTGVSQLNATGRKEPGVTAAAAMRTQIDLASKRFATKARAYELVFPELARRIVEAMSDVDDLTAQWPSKGAMVEIRWSEVKPEEDAYTIRVAPVSSLPRDPAGRLAMSQELYQSGLISGPSFKRLLDWPDLEAEFSRENAEYEYLEQLIDRYLDATEEQAQDPRFVQVPEGFIFGKESAMVQFGAAYFEAKRHDAPEYVLELLRSYILGLDEMLKAAAAPPQMQGGPPAPMQAPAPPGAPVAPGGPPLR